VAPRDASFAPQLLIRQIEAGERIEAFRTVRVADVRHPDLPLSFRSHYEEGLAPRFQQTQHAALHMAVSFWRTEEQALAVARQFFPKHGEYLARAVLSGGQGFDYLDPRGERHPEHLTVWGDPARLAQAVVDITPITPLTL
jgi:hypothetical protein